MQLFRRVRHWPTELENECHSQPLPPACPRFAPPPIWSESCAPPPIVPLRPSLCEKTPRSGGTTEGPVTGCRRHCRLCPYTPFGVGREACRSAASSWNGPLAGEPLCQHLSPAGEEGRPRWRGGGEGCSLAEEEGRAGCLPAREQGQRAPSPGGASPPPEFGETIFVQERGGG